MTWALLHDRDNWLRNGQATITSSPAPKPGYTRDALFDGSQAILYRAVGVADKRIVITPSSASLLTYFAAHDLRIHEGTITGAMLRANLGSGFETLRQWTPAEIEESNWSIGWVGGRPSAVVVEFIVTTTLSGAEWSLGEIVVGSGAIIGGLSQMWPTPARQTVHARTWNTVANGPWRTKLAEPVSSYTLTFPAGREERLRQIYEASGGGLRPVSFMPDTEGPAAVHGHISDEHTISLGLGGVYEESQLLVTESMRSLR